jgi:hypothetical protein
VKGTWQGSGTWQTSGLDVGGLVAAAAAIAAACWAAEVVLQLLWYIVAVLGAAIVGTVLAVVAVQRRVHQHAAMLEATRPARLEAVTGRAVTTQAAPPAIVHYHYHAAPGLSPAGDIPLTRVNLQAAPRVAIDAPAREEGSHGREREDVP